MASLKARAFTLLAASVLLTACSGTTPIAYTGIDSAALLQKNPVDDNHVRFVYSAPNVDLKRYTQIIIDPIKIYTGSDQQFGSVSEADKAEIAKYMTANFASAASMHYRVVQDPSPDTLRLKLTLTGIERNVPVLSTVTKFAPAPTLLNLIQTARGKEGTFAGSVSFVVQVYDSATNRLLEAYVSKQYPFAENIGASFGTLDATRAGVRNGADGFIAELDRLASNSPQAH